MNESEMNGDDPFLELLQGALEMPDDLTLGREGRDLLLAAAAAAATPKQEEKVVAFPLAASAEREGFEWLAGERHAGPGLLEKIVASPELLATLEQERIFLGHLRRALRRPEEIAAAGAVAPAAGRSRGVARQSVWKRPAYTVASMAALLLISAVPVWKSIAHRSGGQGMAASGGGGGAGAGRISFSGVPADLRADRSGRISSGTTGEEARLTRASMPSSVAAGAGCSFAADDPDWVAFHAPAGLAPGGDARMLAKQLLAEPENASTSAMLADDAGEMAANDGRELAANDAPERGRGGYLPGMNADFRIDNNTLLASRGDGNQDLTIPETGGAVPVMVGFMVLLLHRFRRRMPRSA